MFSWLTGSRPSHSAAYDAAARKLSKAELANVQAAFKDAAGSSGTLSQSQLMVRKPLIQQAAGLSALLRGCKEILGIPGVPEYLAKGLFSVVAHPDDHAKDKAASSVSEDAFVCFWASHVKGDDRTREQFYAQLLGAEAPIGSISEPQMTEGVHACLQWACGRSSSRETASAIASEGTHALQPNQVQAWLKAMPCITHTLRSLLPTSPHAPHPTQQHKLQARTTQQQSLQQEQQASATTQQQQGGARASRNEQTAESLAVDPGTEDNGSSVQVHWKFPRLLFPKLTLKTPTLADCMLTREWMWVLSGWLPPEQAETWELLFNSNMHGGSFNTYMGRVANRGPSIVLIRDKQGALFGGFALDPWAKNGKFYGAFGSFVFGLLPALGVWRPTGINRNFLWCGQNFEQLPNGFGFGGQVGYNAVGVDGTFDKGMSRASATFSNPCLASSETFEVDTVEVWLTKQPEEDALSQAAGSALDRFKEDRNFLEMAGKAVQASRGYREAPPEGDL